MYTVYAWENDMIMFSPTFEQLEDARTFAHASLKAKWITKVEIEDKNSNIIEEFVND